MTKGSWFATSAVVIGLSGCAHWHSQPPVAPPPPPIVAESPAPTTPDNASNAALSQATQPTRQELLAEYMDHVRRRIRANMVYKSKNGNPETLLQIVLKPDMTINSVKIVTSSGNPQFDRAAKRAVEKAGSYPPLPEGLEFSMFQTHKIKYRLHDF